jgi:copper chaperone CopZ
MSYYLHHVPGRLRVRTPVIKSNEEKVSDVQNLLKSIHGIRSTSASAVTGSVVIHYDQQAVDPEAITNALTEAGYFDQSKAITNDQYIHNAASKAGQLAWKAVFGAFANSAMQGSPLSLITLLL